MSRDRTIYDVLVALASSCGGQQAFVDRDYQLRGDYAALLARVNRTANWWRELGVAPGERVLWLGQNSARVLEGILACAALGAIFCPVNWRQSEAELRFVLDDVEPVLVIWQREEIGETVEPLRAASSDNQHWVAHDSDAYEYELENSVDVLAVQPAAQSDVPVLMLYTAAFAGQPNGVLITSRAIIAQSENFGDVRGLDSGSRYLNVGPLFHVATLLETMATFYAGGANIFIRRADAVAICQAIAEERCDAAFLLPPVIEQIVALPESERGDIRCLRTLGGSDAWNALVTVDDSLWGRFPYGFGQTETLGYATYSALGAVDGVAGTGPMGKPHRGVELAILDDAGEVLAPGEVGEIAIAGDTVLAGYWRRPELNEARRSGRWHRCNDLGRVEVDGTLSFVGTKQHMIRSGQENIYPAEVESCLVSHPQVREAAVIGIPDEKWDQSVRALVVLEPGAALDEAALIEHCRAHIASYKKPRSVMFVESLPRQGAGFDYAALDAQYGGGGYPGGGH